jgi:hypothetical protein
MLSGRAAGMQSVSGENVLVENQTAVTKHQANKLVKRTLEADKLGNALFDKLVGPLPEKWQRGDDSPTSPSARKAKLN